MQENHRQLQEEALPVLINNAYDFLGSALNSLESDTKSSVIDFYTAVEIFLKAPLLNEHWSLIVSKDPQVTKFLKGDFISVSFSESIKRLKDVLKIEITQDAKNAFDKVRQHRNKYVHFFMNEEQASTAQIALEQLSAWAHLHSLMNNQFLYIFHEYEKQNFRIKSALKRHQDFWREYAKLEYDQLGSFFAKKEQEGFNLTQCSTCSVKSLMATERAQGSYTDFHCPICRLYRTELRVKCPNCEDNTSLTQGGYSSCEYCLHPFTPDEVFHIVNTYRGSRKPGDAIEDIIPANCEYCGGYETVCQLGNHYLCSNCFELTSSIGRCEYCSDPTNMSDTSESYAEGCAFCDGAIGNANW